MKPGVIKFVSFFRLSLRWDQVNSISSVWPRYLTSVEWKMMTLLIVMGEQLWGLSEKVTKDDLDLLILIFQLVYHQENPGEFAVGAMRWYGLKMLIIRWYHMHMF